jgi:hypothetical protein
VVAIELALFNLARRDVDVQGRRAAAAAIAIS